MKLSDFVSVEAIRPNVVATNKEGVIREMAQSLVDAGKIAADMKDGVLHIKMPKTAEAKKHARKIEVKAA